MMIEAPEEYDVAAPLSGALVILAVIAIDWLWERRAPIAFGVAAGALGVIIPALFVARFVA